MAKELSYIEKITAFISNMRDNNGAEPGPTPASLIPFAKNQVIKGFDFGNVNNGDTNADLDAFLLGLEVSMEPQPLMFGSDDVMLLATHIVVPDVQINAGVIFGGDFDHDIPGDIVFYYSTDTFEMEGMQIVKGYQNLTDGKFGYLDPNTTSTVSDVREDESLWNGIFVGAVEAEPGPTPPGPEPTMPKFVAGGTINAGDKVQFDTSISDADMISLCESFHNYYDDQGVYFLVDSTSSEFGEQPARLGVIRMDMGEGNYLYILTLLDGAQMPGLSDPIWTSQTSWSQTALDENNCYTMKNPQAKPDLYSYDVVLGVNEDAWNGVVAGLIKGE